MAADDDAPSLQGRHSAADGIARVVVLLWAVAVAWSAIVALRLDPSAAMGRVDPFVEPEHRIAAGRSAVLVRAPDPDTADAAALEIARAHAELFVPAAAPTGEINAWLDSHALYLLPVGRHAELAERLTDSAIAGAVQDLAARVASPAFGLTGRDARRDPLGLAPMLQSESSVLGIGDAGSGIVANARGDLVDGRGTVFLRVDPVATEGALASAWPEIEMLADAHGAEVRRSDETVESLHTGRAIQAELRRLAPIALAALGLVLAVGLRDVKRGLVALLVVASVGLGSLAAWSAWFGDAGGLDATTATLIGMTMLAALGIAGASQHRAGIALAYALPPAILVLSPYAGWVRWAGPWLGATLVAATLGVLGVPALGRALGLRPVPGDAGPQLPAVISIVVGIGLALASITLTEAPAVAAVDLPAATAVRAEREARAPFDEDRRRVEVESRARPDAAADDAFTAALDRAADDTRWLATLVPDHASVLRAPGGFVIERRRLERRRVSLAELGLKERMQVLHDALLDRGFRPEAFGEFLRGTADLSDAPDARAAVEGPLGRWIDGHRGLGERRDRVRTDVYSVRDALPDLVDDDGTALTLRGLPLDARGETPWIARRLIVAGAMAGAAAAAVAIVSAGFGVALLALISAAASLGTACLVARFFGPGVGAHLVASFAFVAATGAITVLDRAGQHGGDPRSGIPLSPVVLAAAHAAVGAAAMISGDELTQGIGAVIAIGGTVAVGLGAGIAGLRAPRGAAETPPRTPRSSTPETPGGSE